MSAALEKYCGSVFWNASYLQRADPDLPVCVERTVLVWFPVLFLWLCAPWHFTSFCKKSAKAPASRLYICKQIVCGLLFLTAVAELALTLGEDYGPSSEYTLQKHPAVLYIKPVLFAVSWIVVMLCQESMRRRVKSVDSGSLFLFWILQVLCAVFQFQTLLREALAQDEVPDVPHFSLFYISYGLQLIALVLSAIADLSPEVKKLSQTNPEAKATFLSRITFNWFNSMVIKGYKRPLVQEDMWDLKEEESTHSICQQFEDVMTKELRKARSVLQKKRNKRLACDDGQNGLAKGVSHDVLVMEETGKKKDKKKAKKDSESDYPQSWLIPTIVKSFKGVLLESAFFRLIQDLLAFASPQLLKLMIAFVQDKSSHAWSGYLYAVLPLLVAFLQSVILQQYFQRCFVLGMKVRTAIMAAIYKKALVVSNDSRKESTAGEIVNLMSADAQRFNNVTNFIHLLWSCPLQIALSIAFLWIELGPSVLAGLLVMVLMVPINGWLATKSRAFQVENMKFKDSRMKIVNDILNGIKILKYYAWESSFESQVQAIREKELKVMRKFAYLSSVSTFIFSCAPAIVSLATFAVFVSVSPDNILDAEKAFTSISLLNILRFPLSMLPQLISIMVQTAVSKKRLEKFLSGSDLDMTAIKHDDSNKAAVSMTDGTFAWERETEPVLKHVSLDIAPGRLVAVVGAVGSGKTSLILALLGELHCLKGHININGINLSGGQKQRSSLARAVYSSADVFLLDDPLSAVDSHVGKHLFEQVIGPEGLLRNKTRILVTHGISFLPYVDEIVVLVNGVVSEVGSYNALRASKGAFNEFMETYGKEDSKATGNKAAAQESDYEEIDTLPAGLEPQADGSPEDIVSNTVKRENSLRHSQRNGSVKVRKNSSLRSKKDSGDKKGQRLIEKETMETGRVKFSVYLQYLRAMGWCYVTWSFLIYFIQNVAIIGQNLWLSDWTYDAEDYFNTTYPNHIRDTRIGVFGALGIAQGFLVFLGTILLVDGSICASRTLHTNLLSNILKVPMVFFDTTPSGRVVNHFTKDIFTVDELIPMSFRSWILCLLGVLGTLFVICLATPIFTAVVVPMAVIYYFVLRFYVATSRQLRRLDSVSRSPIYSHFGETVSGLSVIRAYGHQQRFLKQNEDTIDQNLKSVYPWIVSNRWLAMRLESLGNLVVFFSALFAVISRDSLNSGLVGLSISYALNVTQTLNWLVRITSELETNIVAVERVSEYTEIKNEAPWITSNRPPDDWPSAGNIRFENYKVRYRPELELILHGITCDIETTEKIGIVGRTGAGKSSLTNCLFRIIEASEGRIIIDGIDISTLELHDLRSRLTIIPQHPVLFSGTLRMNLDPFLMFSDEEIWNVLELAHLKDYVQGLPTGLTHEVAEGGENLSLGQRQLLCLARALLRKSRILILDEATAAVDLETDDLIQSTIRREFSHCTVLTIAHRLNTILDSSRVMVLDSGKIVEFDSPSTLLHKQGHFYSMAKDAGI
ncbi:ATP-binding cassette sub-family C member 2-like [Siphateles boraxobius]|uniref:ATP-binding cassette sub-family C member 2-like n=1 Tax=Siphateles boraxobius TaxID=180520 RepID=UPI00406414A6